MDWAVAVALAVISSLESAVFSQTAAKYCCSLKENGRFPGIRQTNHFCVRPGSLDWHGAEKRRGASNASECPGAAAT